MPTVKSPTAVRLTLAQYWQVTKQHRTNVVFCLLLPLSSILLFVAVPLFASKILAGLVTDRQNLWEYFWLVLILTIVGLKLNAVGIRNCMALQAKVMDDLFNKLFKNLMQRSVGFYSNQVGGKLVSDATDYIVSYGQIANAGFIGAFTFAVTTITGLIIIFISSPILGLMVTVLLSALVVWTRHESKTRAELRQERLKINKRLISHLSDSLVNAVTVKTFARENQEYKTGQKISDELKEARSIDWQRTVTNETHRVSVLFAAELALIGGLIIITQKHPEILATGIFAFTYTINLLGRFFTVNTMVRQLDDSLLTAQPMAEMLQEEPEIKDAPNSSPLKVTAGAVDFNNVTFHYADTSATDTVFSNLDLSIKAGEKVGLVGQSGGGKTTLTRLLLRFDDITDGSIAIDGQNIAGVTQTSLRKQIAYVPQEPLLFHRSIRENIGYGKHNAPLAAIHKAAHQAHAADFIESLPQGYDTIVGERGVKLSGGQRQRIAIARALLKNAPILVLDEATSALDSESEILIQAALWKLMEGRTAIVIAHRLSTIQKMDRIVVLDNGVITEQGSHKELLAHNGTYAKLWAHQSGGFIED